MLRFLAFIYGVLAYAAFLGVFLYAIAFVCGLPVPVNVDTPSRLGAGQAAIVDLVLLGLFGVQHSGMARRAFKRAWTKVVPEHVERSTFVWASNAALALVMWQWQGIPAVVWQAESPALRVALWALAALGWLLLLVSTFAVSHADLFGLRQVYYHLRERAAAPFKLYTGSLYGIVRHPIMLGFVIAFWAAPTMTAGHLLFSAVATGYIIAAIQLEERDLMAAFGDAYRRYRREVPMLVPFRGRRAAGRSATTDS